MQVLLRSPPKLSRDIEDDNVNDSLDYPDNPTSRATTPRPTTPRATTPRATTPSNDHTPTLPRKMGNSGSHRSAASQHHLPPSSSPRASHHSGASSRQRESSDNNAGGGGGVWTAHGRQSESQPEGPIYNRLPARSISARASQVMETATRSKSMGGQLTRQHTGPIATGSIFF